MKGIIKLFPVALAVVALASCSNDEFESTGTDFSNVKNGMVVTLENSDVTRAGIAKLDGERSIVWELKDTMRLYDPEKLAYDWYVMDDANGVGKEEAVFTPKGSKVTPVVDESIVLFPNSQIYAYSNGDKPDETRVTMSIPSKFNYAQIAAEVNGESVTGSHSVLPLWGPVKNYVEADKRVDVRMYYLTSALELDLNVIPADVDLITITTDHTAALTEATLDGEEEPLTGLFDAVLTKNASGKYDAASSFNVVQLKKNSGFTNGCEIEIEIPFGSIARYGNAKFYVPIIAQDYKSILIQAFNENNHVTAIWAKELKSSTAGKKFTASRGKYLRTSGEFQQTIDGASYSDIQNALKKYTSDVILNITTAGVTGTTLEIPSNLDGKNVTLNFENALTGNNEVTVTGKPASLTIVTETGSTHSYTFSTEGANVKLTGEFPTIITTKDKFGTAATLSLEAAEINTLTTNEGIVNINADETEITTFEHKAAQTVNIALDEAVADVNVVTTMTVNNGATVNVTGIARTEDEDGNPVDPVTATIGTLNVTTKKATINLSDAIITTLKNEKQGDNKNITEVTAKGISTIGEVTSATVANKDKAIAATKITSTWDGESKVASATTGEIYTAAQLAKLLDAPITADQTLYADINLDNKDWTGIAANAELTFAGNGHKISNIALKNSSKTQDGLGFFKTVATDKLTVNNLTLEGVKAQFTSYATTGDKEFNVTNIGGLVGKATAAVEATDVTVSLAGDYFGYATTSNSKAAGIGGLIGQSKAATLNGVVVTGSAINGYSNLGGFIGEAKGAVTIGKAAKANCIPQPSNDKVSNAAITAFNVTYNTKTGSEKLDADMNYAKIGAMIGTVNANAVSDEIAINEDEYTATALAVNGIPEGMLNITIVDGGAKIYNFKRDKQDLIGFSGHGYAGAAPEAAIGYKSVTINGAAFTMPAVGKTPKSTDNFIYYFQAQTE